MEFDNRVILGDCLEVLQQLPDNTFDSCVTDPPYGLGTKEPTVEEIISYLQGEELDTGGDFMGKRWSVPSLAVWREVYRVLKPGGHVLSFGGTRTFDLISLGLRAVGFENRDTIADDHPALQWKHGQGFPKSLNVGKALEGTADASKFDGYGTALKPAWEPILVFRKPLEGTVADNVLEHGTGALNIDATRVGTSKDVPASPSRTKGTSLSGSVDGSLRRETGQEGGHDPNVGRWPPNVVMTHAGGCKRVGTKKIKGITGGETVIRRSGVHAEAGGHQTIGRKQTPRKGHSDEDGTETVAAWDCVEGCPIKELDEQSVTAGVHGAGHTRDGDMGTGHQYDPESMPLASMADAPRRMNRFGDAGGASRFFPQFEGQELVEVPFFYTGKATKKGATLDGEIENKHPTKKPVRLMAWLVKLVTQKDGLVLDPYCGSGSTLHAAVEEGMRFTGIDSWDYAYEVATKRMEIVCQRAESRQGQEDLFAMAMGGYEDA